MNRPWLKFYPSDWRADPALRMCSVAARGMWMEMLCLMHEAEPRGSLLINGQPVSVKQLASLAGVSVREATALVSELEEAGVFSREDNGTIYSRRMRRDEEKATKDKANGALGGNPDLKGGVNPPVNGEDKAQIPDARDQNPKRKVPRAGKPAAANDDFEKFKEAYPKRDGGNPWPPAQRLFEAAVRDGTPAEQIIAAARAGVGFDKDAIGTKFIPQAVKWLRGKYYLDYLNGTEADNKRRAELELMMEAKGYVWLENKWVQKPPDALQEPERPAA